MKCVIHQIKVNLAVTLTKTHIAKKLKCNVDDIIDFKIIRQSLDARNDKIQYIYSVVADIKHGDKYFKLSDVTQYQENNFKIDKIKNQKSRPVVIGLGPSGLFAALTLATSGAKPIVFEMGQPVEKRVKDVDTFLKTRQLNLKSNIQYGEGGAGTFSDGKLTCRIKDERIPWILEQFVQAGANESILYESLPHIGTDQLQLIIPRLREKIIELGGEVYFNSELSDIDVSGGHVHSITVNNDQVVACDNVFLCSGHSNVELYQMLYSKNINIISKDISIGVRIEHPQDFINQARYHQHAGNPLLPVANYNLAYQDSDGYGIYTFCMCPGGVIMASNAQENTIVTNGMSNSKRDGQYGNAAVLVQVKKAQYQSDHPLAGFDYIHDLERKAYIAGGNNYDAPGLYIKDFMAHKVSTKPIITTYPFNVVPYDFEKLFGSDWCTHMFHALTNFDHKMQGYIHPDATMVAVESKSSCPIRIVRDFNTSQSISTQGLYPCGEGAGYAGGIISSCLDGVKCALKYIEAQNSL